MTPISKQITEYIELIGEAIDDQGFSGIGHTIGAEELENCWRFTVDTHPAPNNNIIEFFLDTEQLQNMYTSATDTEIVSHLQTIINAMKLAYNEINVEEDRDMILTIVWNTNDQ